jgi:hypothetical protein
MTTPSRTAGKPRRKDLALTTVQAMLPLVRGIVAEIVTAQMQIADLTPRKEHLDQFRRELVWQERQDRYRLADDLSRHEKTITDATAELKELGVVMIDLALGRVGFPTRVDDEKAYFSWQPNEPQVAYWHFAGERSRRPIPNDWRQETPVPVRAGRRG